MGEKKKKKKAKKAANPEVANTAELLQEKATKVARKVKALAENPVVAEVVATALIATAAAPGPLAFGLVRRYVAFPRDFADRYDADECELALAHEIGHHQRGDLFANWVALIVLALHWFNPVAWHAFRRFRADQELANDARVLAGRSAVDRHIYACAIVKAAHGGAVSAACHLHTITDLKGRLRMLTNTRLSRTRRATGAVAILGAVTAGLIVTASGTRAAAADTIWSETFLPVPSAAAAARHFVTATLGLWGLGDLSWEASLVVSELATNAVQHGASPFRASVSRTRGVLRIAVEDVAPGRPERRAATRDLLDGRGVAIIEALTRRSGCDILPDSKIVWAELSSGPRRAG